MLRSVLLVILLVPLSVFARDGGDGWESPWDKEDTGSFSFGSGFSSDEMDDVKRELDKQGPIISGGTNVCDNGGILTVMDKANFGASYRKDFGPSYKLSFDDRWGDPNKACYHYLKDHKLPLPLQNKVIEILGGHEPKTGTGLMSFIINGVFSGTNPMMWIGIKRPFSRSYLRYIKPGVSCSRIRSLIGYVGHGMAIVSFDEFNGLPADQQLLAIVHEILRKIQIEYLGDVSEAVTAAVEETAMYIIYGSAIDLKSLPFFRLLGERASQGLSSVCEKVKKLPQFNSDDDKIVDEICSANGILNRMGARGFNQVENALIATMRGVINRILENGQLGIDDKEDWQEAFDLVHYISNSSPARHSGVAAAALTSGNPWATNLHTINMDDGRQRATCEAIKSFQW